MRNKDYTSIGFVRITTATRSIVPNNDRILALRDSEISFCGESYAISERICG